MYGAGVHHVKTTGTQWIDHKIRAKGHVIEKFNKILTRFEKIRFLPPLIHGEVQYSKENYQNK